MAEETTPKKKVMKPLNPLLAKPGQNYGSTKFAVTKEYEAGQITFKEDKDKKEPEKEQK